VRVVDPPQPPADVGGEPAHAAAVEDEDPRLRPHDRRAGDGRHAERVPRPQPRDPHREGVLDHDGVDAGPARLEPDGRHAVADDPDGGRRRGDADGAAGPDLREGEAAHAPPPGARARDEAGARAAGARRHRRRARRRVERPGREDPQVGGEPVAPRPPHVDAVRRRRGHPQAARLEEGGVVGGLEGPAQDAEERVDLGRHLRGVAPGGGAVLRRDEAGQCEARRPSRHPRGRPARWPERGGDDDDHDHGERECGDGGEAANGQAGEPAGAGAAARRPEQLGLEVGEEVGHGRGSSMRARSPARPRETRLRMTDSDVAAARAISAYSRSSRTRARTASR
jgi:hypothetical protein